MAKKKEVIKVSENENIYGGENSLTSVAPADLTETPEEKALREETMQWSQSADAAFINLARNLHRIRNTETECGTPVYVKWGHHTFREYVESELGCTLRKAEYLMKIWDYYVVQLGNGSTKVLDKVKNLGLTKLRECIDIVQVDKIDEFVEKASHMSVKGLIEMKKETQINEALSADVEKTGSVSPDEKEISEDNAQKTFRMNFKLYADQYKEVTEALEKAAKIGDTSCNNQQLMYICRDFLSFGSQDSVKAKIENCKRFEKQHDVLILVVDKKTNEVIYGADLEKRMGIEKTQE